MRDAEAVTFARGALDRAAHLRGARGLAATRARSASRSGRASRYRARAAAAPRLAADGRRGLRRRRRPARLPRGRRRRAAVRPRNPRLGGRRHRPAPLLRRQPRPSPGLPESLDFGDLRAVMAELSVADAGTAAAAKGILGWHASHRFCARCGARLRGGRRGLEARLPRLRRRAFPPHRPRRHHADPARQLGPPRPLRRLAAGDVLAARRLHGARRVDRGRRPPRGLGGGGRAASARSTTSPASPGLSPPA